MSMTKQWAALAVAALVVGCGGGDSTEATTSNAARAMRALAVSAPSAVASAVAPAVAAELLLNFAEAHADLEVYFPGHQATQDAGPFKYRYYPSTGIYLGVVVSADPTYLLNHVYVLGGVFGDVPIDVGPLTNYVTPTEPNPGGTNNGCADLSLYDTQGTRTVMTHAYSGVITGTVTSDTLVGALTSFEGQQAREVVTTTTGSQTIGGMTASADGEIKSYQRKSGDAEVTNYGSVIVKQNSVGGISTTTTLKTVWSPPWVSREYGLAVGQSLSVTQSGSTTSTMTYSIPGYPPVVNTSSSTLTETVKYVGRESVTVPAGTFEACKFERTNAEDGSLSTNWLSVGNGLPLKTVIGSGTEMMTMQATSITVNGQPL
ncbi:hypothetical protein [Aquabacterium sp.]|uniref:hypothetical protein n=1 Tax=Aquabacterium sp. TaxID=1872578 RepID=UPI002C21803B|nr:hypothetical protein [Aquabacterium sp.]HSW09085.1 hypothetical protein [Aquabacterium sp.]